MAVPAEDSAQSSLSHEYLHADRKDPTLVRKADSSEHFPTGNDSFVDLQFIELLDMSRWLSGAT
jgi:hypothetical protein